MKALVVYYSRTGNTEKLATAIAEKSGTDLLPITEEKPRQGLSGALLSCWHSFAEKKPPIAEFEVVLEDYPLVIVGTPIWAGNLAAPVRTFLVKYRQQLDRVAFFATFGVAASSKVFDNMQQLAGKRPESVFGVSKKELQQNQYAEAVDQFVEELKNRCD